MIATISIEEFEDRWGAKVVGGPHHLNGFWAVDIQFKGRAIKWIISCKSFRATRTAMDEKSDIVEVSSITMEGSPVQVMDEFVDLVIAYENTKLEKQRGIDMKNSAKNAILDKLFLNVGDEVKFYDCDYGPHDGAIREGRVVKARHVPGKVAIRTSDGIATVYIPREHIIDVYRW